MGFRKASGDGFCVCKPFTSLHCHNGSGFEEPAMLPCQPTTLLRLGLNRLDKMDSTILIIYTYYIHVYILYITYNNILIKQIYYDIYIWIIWSFGPLFFLGPGKPFSAVPGWEIANSARESRWIEHLSNANLQRRESVHRMTCYTAIICYRSSSHLVADWFVRARKQSEDHFSMVVRVYSTLRKSCLNVSTWSSTAHGNIFPKAARWNWLMWQALAGHETFKAGVWS